MDGVTETRNPEKTEGFASESTTWRSYVAEAPAWFIVFGALAVSFWTQVFAVGHHDLAYWESLIWGTSTDAGTIAFLFLVREDTFRGRPTWGAWLGSIACAFMSVQWNVIPDWSKGDYLGVEAHLWMPALALGTWYWLLHGRKRRNPAPTPRPEPDPEPEPPAPLPPRPSVVAQLPVPTAVSIEPEPLPEPNGRVPVTLAVARREYRRLAKLSPDGRVTGAALGKALGVSDVSGRSWKGKVEGKVVAASKPADTFRIEVAA